MKRNRVIVLVLFILVLSLVIAFKNKHLQKDLQPKKIVQETDPAIPATLPA